MKCAGCDRPMIPHRAWRADSEHARKQFAPHRGRGLCVACHSRAYRADTLIDHERSHRVRDDLIEEALWQVEQFGSSYAELPALMGMKRHAFTRAVRRARLAGDERAATLAALNTYRTKEV